MPESTELAISPRRAPAEKLYAKPNKQDRARWFLFKRNVPVDEIAKRHNCTLVTVQKSIERMEAYNAQTSNEIVDMRRNEMAINLADKTEAALGRALDAKTIVRRENKHGKMVVVSRDPDHKTQLAAAAQVKEILTATIPKGAGVSIAVQQNNTQQVDNSRRSNFVDLLRAARERRGMTNSDNVIQAEFEDVDETAEEDEEESDDDSAE